MTLDAVTSSLHEGGCLCGAVRYRVAGAPLSSVVCHCTSCRKASGAAAVAWVEFDRNGFAWTAGVPRRRRSSPRAVRGFCADCGTALTFEADDSAGTIDVTTASLDDPAAWPPTREIWLDDKVRWQAVDPALDHRAQGSG